MISLGSRLPQTQAILAQTCESFITNTMPQGQKTWSKKRPKGIKKETTNIYQPHSISLYFPSEKQTKNILFFVITQKKIKALFFVTSLKKKKASFKNLCHSIPKRFNLNTTVPLLRILPSPLYSTPYGTEKLELFLVLQYLCSKRYLPFFLLYVLYFSN